jgi:hypothetical protein
MARRNLMGELMAAEASAAQVDDELAASQINSMRCEEVLVPDTQPTMHALTQNLYAYAAGDADASPEAELEHDLDNSPFSDQHDADLRQREYYRNLHGRLIKLVNMMSTFTNAMQASIAQLQDMLHTDFEVA